MLPIATAPVRRRGRQSGAQTPPDPAKAAMMLTDKCYERPISHEVTIISVCWFAAVPFCTPASEFDAFRTNSRDLLIHAGPSCSQSWVAGGAFRAPMSFISHHGQSPTDRLPARMVSNWARDRAGANGEANEGASGSSIVRCSTQMSKRAQPLLSQQRRLEFKSLE